MVCSVKGRPFIQSRAAKISTGGIRCSGLNKAQAKRSRNHKKISGPNKHCENDSYDINKTNWISNPISGATMLPTWMAIPKLTTIENMKIKKTNFILYLIEH